MEFFLSILGLLGMFIFLIAITIPVAIIGFQNDFVRRKNRVEEAASNIEIQLIRRSDLVLNIVETVKGYAKHESSTLEKVINARKQTAQVNIDKESSLQDKMNVSQKLTSELSKLMVVVEKYPELKADTQFNSLQNSLENIENRISTYREEYNLMTRRYNTDIEQFPKSIVAKRFGFQKKEFLVFDGQNFERPTVKF
ncbi:membrane protein [Companilactobacillus sp. RD055328]|uniref:LemA family protein n=1 Tax=Companilactobacillus sp. RD055328 TaxID=2916634 RepID=UPI001FC8C9D2|nr:LemA family protein [Companilactobacillus sp. RD055328]GKQ43035.1 membrane protein [Companilactobacillus sp. RD055328]